MIKSFNIMFIPDRSVVRAKDHQSVLLHSCKLQGVENTSDHGINHHSEVAVHPRTTLANEGFIGKPGRMRGRVGQIQEKRLLRLTGGMVFNHLNGFIGESW